MAPHIIRHRSYTLPRTSKDKGYGENIIPSFLPNKTQRYDRWTNAHDSDTYQFDLTEKLFLDMNGMFWRSRADYMAFRERLFNVLNTFDVFEDTWPRPLNGIQSTSIVRFSFKSMRYLHEDCMRLLYNPRVSFDYRPMLFFILAHGRIDEDMDRYILRAKYLAIRRQSTRWLFYTGSHRIWPGEEVYKKIMDYTKILEESPESYEGEPQLGPWIMDESECIPSGELGDLSSNPGKESQEFNSTEPDTVDYIPGDLNPIEPTISEDVPSDLDLSGSNEMSDELTPPPSAKNSARNSMLRTLLTAERLASQDRSLPSEYIWDGETSTELDPDLISPSPSDSNLADELADSIPSTREDVAETSVDVERLISPSVTSEKET